MRVLLDTCALSELRLPQPNAGVARAIQELDSEDLFVSVISIGEIAKGVALLKDGQKKRLLQSWLQTLERHYKDRLLPIDLETSRMWGELTATAQQAGRTIPASDGLIAAAARRHGLYLMTRNTADFEPSGVPLINPWEHA
ncbi:MAG TPA: type II toxin-antitoxin system VapC family toxin [Bryobacteraceae bacterium]|nr:type II toxin-antitoxin system VapC family toxin [Bryobacteraceae bacterium]